MLDLTDVHTYYGNIRALRGVSLAVQAGEIVTLIGANGAGKTTTLRTILGSIRPRRVPANDGAGKSGARRLRPARPGGHRPRLRAGVHAVPAPARADRPAGRHAFRRRAADAGHRSRPHGPAYPAAARRTLHGLSPILVDTIFQILRDINRQGTTILLVEQNARMALRVAHRGYVIQTGRIVLQDAAAELLRSDLVRKTYLGEK